MTQRNSEDLRDRAEVMVEEIERLAPPEVTATADEEGVGEILAELDPQWLPALPAIARAVQAYARLRRAQLHALLVRELVDAGAMSMRHAQCESIVQRAQDRLIARHGQYAARVDDAVRSVCAPLPNVADRWPSAEEGR